MRIVIAGTVHQDPLCRSELRRMLATRKTAEVTSPRFVAVEADPDHFAEIESLRPTFKLKARRAWPELSDEVIDKLSLTMLFEGDTHSEFFPDVDVVWLDRGRVPSSASDVSQFDDRRLAFYQPWIESRRALSAGFEAQSMLHYLSSAAKLGVAEGPPWRDPQRDLRWYSEMLPHIEHACDADWGLVVCGAEHGLPENGNIAELLQLSGHLVEFEDLVRAVS